MRIILRDYVETLVAVLVVFLPAFTVGGVVQAWLTTGLDPDVTEVISGLLIFEIEVALGLLISSGLRVIALAIIDRRLRKRRSKRFRDIRAFQRY